MPRPSRLKLVDERPVPVREIDDAVAEPPVAAMQQVSEGEAAAIIDQLRREVELQTRRANEVTAAAAEAGQKARADLDAANQTTAALRDQALTRIGEVEQERNAAVAAVAKSQEDRRQTAAVAAAVGLGLLQKAAAEVGRLAAWVPALGSLLGGWCLFNRIIAAPSLPSLGALALYGVVVVGPAVLVTLKKGA